MLDALRESSRNEQSLFSGHEASAGRKDATPHATYVVKNPKYASAKAMTTPTIPNAST
jgi:hypothetical protein